jgi:hypothetical protein
MMAPHGADESTLLRVLARRRVFVSEERLPAEYVIFDADRLERGDPQRFWLGEPGSVTRRAWKTR